MRTLRNDTLASSFPLPEGEGVAEQSEAGRGDGRSAPPPDAARLPLSPSGRGDEPTRTCILTRMPGTRGGLIRLALGPDGQVHPDVRAKAPGRGAWVGVDRAALDVAVAKGRLKGALSRAFRTGAVTVPADLGQRIADALARAALDRLGLEARASTLVTGSERIDEAARKGALHALYHAADAGSDGNRKLDQAWRVGEGEEGSARRGLVMSVDRIMLSVALGRENVVHIGMIDARAAGRVAAAIDRWHRFIGWRDAPDPCTDTAQGSSGRGNRVEQNDEGS